MDIDTAVSTPLEEPVKCAETDALLSPLQPVHLTFQQRLSQINCQPKQLCLPSKSAILIILWTFVVNAMYKAADETVIHIFGKKDYELPDRHLAILFVYLVPILVLLLYPFAGFIADVCYGRYRTVIISLCLLLCGFVCFSITAVMLFTNIIQPPYYTTNKIPYYIPICAGILFFITGLSGYQANYIQLGLDQLMELPSEYLGLFMHWLEWSIEIGYLIVRPLFLLYNNCSPESEGTLINPVYESILALSFLFLLGLFLLLLFGYWKRHWFYSEPGQNNPYKIVFSVLNFARKHRYPLRRSAFTFCDDEIPSRLDFAKERYGGPFTTQQVEDVKAFLRILTILLVLGPMYFLQVPIGSIFSSYSDHIGSNTSGSQHCSWSSVIYNMTILGNLAVVVFFPIYIWLLYTVLRKCIPRTFVRIWVAELLLLLGIMAMFILDLSGHVHHYHLYHQAAACVFTENVSDHSFYLDLPWAVNILPSFLTQAAIVLLLTSTFEFISAQSPHSMKGLLIGVFYAVQGTFRFLAAISTLPFSVQVIWASDYMKKHTPSITNCGFGYLLLNCAVGIFSIVVFSVAAKRYKYRERDDPPFNQMTVERVWANSIQ